MIVKKKMPGLEGSIVSTWASPVFLAGCNSGGFPDFNTASSWGKES